MNLSRLQQDIVDAFTMHGDMTDEKLVNLSMFAPLKDSTVWKRRSELTKLEIIIKKGEAKNARGKWMTVWGLK